ncbi:ABC transporter ATP-binding protein [Polynucleobacter sp. AP-Feld-500C-C5]|uniref:ATP-binding cassette domain-containing protein n=1 Tax=Polynucleobacter sp. AP-Feld-500C-C5 TaxID=2576924 RepID=UPI001C0AD67C|nr:ABC transporter ATP-binding protein [Polynucleobacter sp. AP-Feld-500C-C5]MBU3632879.1 ABC transporter ATP-binding protein [Polynucleobacter sp. AP-Feld-500C-C5]
MKTSLWKILLGLWKFIDKKYKKYTFIVIFLMVFTALAEAISVSSVIPFMALISQPDKVINNLMIAELFSLLNLNLSLVNVAAVLTLIFVMAVILAAALRLVLLWAVISLSFRVGSGLSLKMFENALFLDYEEHKLDNSSRLISGITAKIDCVITGAFMPCMALVSSTAILIAILGSLLYVNPILTLFIFTSTISLYITIISIVKNKTQDCSLEIAKNSTKTLKIIQEGLGGIRDVLMGGYQRYYISSYRSADLSLKQAQGSNNFIGQSPRYLIESIATVGIAIAVFFANSRSNNLSNILPLLGAIAFAIQKLMPVFQQGYQAYINLHANITSLQEALILLNRNTNHHRIENCLSSVKFEDAIKFINLSFHYKNSDQLILHDINLRIPMGARVGVIGPSGSGKSTFLDLLMGLLTPTVGEIVVGNNALDKNNTISWQKNISHVPQSVFLIDGTIAENIALGIPKEKIDYTLLLHSIELSKLTDLVANYEKGVDQVIGEGGGRLSGGQRQRIGIARALYKKSQLLIMDEATSSLDVHTENLIMESIYGLNKNITIFIASHRLSILSNCDYILEVIDGKVTLMLKEKWSRSLT